MLSWCPHYPCLGTVVQRSIGNYWCSSYRRLPLTLCYEIRCGTHRCGVSSTHGYECIHTIPYDGCNSHTVIYPPSERARISFVEITRNAAQFAIRNSRNSQFGEMQWQSCRQLSIEVAVWLVQGNGASAHMLLQCVAALQSYRGPHGGHLVAETR